MSTYVGRCAALFLLLSCYRHDAGVLREAQLQRATSSSIDCGDARAGEPTRRLHDCMVTAFARKQPFHGRFWKQGIDSAVATGLALDPKGQLFSYQFDSAPCGAPGRCKPRLKETRCVRPAVRDTAGGKELLCVDRGSVSTTKKVSTERPMRVGGNVKPPRVIHRVEPKYGDCKDVIVSGVPVLEATIDTEGIVRDLRLLKAIDPCVDRSILEAVRQWRFEPGTLDGRPVPVLYNLIVHIHVK
ncbi:MAG TPA: energy transducer TonB [Thermoanaerobaculia bacterium]|nr:energy transducer TonB [Thermoanaerobaculia bacterium]